MVEETNEKVSRRRVLRLSGAGIAAVAGNTVVGTAAAKGLNDRDKQHIRHRASKKEQNKSKFIEGKRVGFAKGGFNKPVTSKTIDKLYSGVIGESAGKERVAVPRPAKIEGKPERPDPGPRKGFETHGNVKDAKNEVMGIVVSEENGDVKISIRRKPTGIDRHLAAIRSQSSSKDKHSVREKAIEGEIHKEVDELLDKRKNSNNVVNSADSGDNFDDCEFDESSSVYYGNGECSEKIGEIKLVSQLKREDYVAEKSKVEDGEALERTNWSLSQKGHMMPLAAGDNADDWDFNEDYFGGQYDCWRNHWAHLTQDWGRSELEELVNYEYQPSYGDEKTTRLTGSVGVSAPTGVSLSVSVAAPKLEIQSELHNEEDLKAEYDFWGWGGLSQMLDAADEEAQLGTATSFDSARPSPGDKIVPSYFYGRFAGPGWKCGYRETCTTDPFDYDDVTKGTSVFEWFREEEIDELESPTK